MGGYLAVAQGRAMSPRGRAAAESLAAAVVAMGVRTAAPFDPAFLEVQAGFEHAVEIFAGDGYRARRARKLADFANELAAEVGKSGQEAVTDVLNPMERRLIHTALVDHPDVETYSEGDEPNRYVVVTPRRDTK